MKIAVVGTGYVGLVSATCFAELGNTTIGVDIDQAKIDGLKQGILPIYEPGLEELVVRNHQEGRLVFTTDVASAIQDSQIVFSAVGTPPDQDHKADLSAVKAVARSFAENLGDSYKILVNKSTVPVGTAAMCTELIREIAGPDAQFDVVSNPEFLREGAAVKDTFNPERIVVGSETEQARELMDQLYQPLVRAGRCEMVHTSTKNAEIIKYAANSFLATKISYINELANFCDMIGEGVDIKDIARGIGLDSRIGPRFLHAGIGYGGSCFPKDIRALIEKGKEVGYNFRIIQEVDRVNEAQKKLPVKKLRQHIKDLRGKTIAIWGLAFKPKTDDMRDAPAIEVIYELTKLGANVRAFDPVANENARRIFDSLSNVEIIDNAYDALDGADALLLLTEWNEFRSPDFERMRTLMKGNVVVDGRNVWEAEFLEGYDLRHASLGR